MEIKLKKLNSNKIFDYYSTYGYTNEYVIRSYRTYGFKLYYGSTIVI